MEKKRNGGLKVLKVAGGVLLIAGGISGFSNYVIQNNFIGALISAAAFFLGIWLIGQAFE